MSNFNGDFNIVSALLIGFGQGAIKHKNLGKTTSMITVCNLYDKNIFFCCEG